MRASIRIPKENLKDLPVLSHELTLFCAMVKEELDACVYTPHPGLLMACLNLLGKHKINYEMVYGGESDITHLNH